METQQFRNTEPCSDSAALLRGAVLRLACQAALVALILLALLSSACRKEPNFGDPLMKRAGVPSSVTNYKYVADTGRMLYWPNQAKYINQIPKASRVWIQDDATLGDFKGYSPGPR